MKKALIVILALVLSLILISSAMAAQVSLGNTGLYITLTSDFEQESLTSQDRSYGMVAYWAGDDLDVAIYTDDSGYTVDSYLDEFEDESDIEECGYAGMINGLQFGYVVYQSCEDNYCYYVLDYFTEYNGTLVEIVFYMSDLSDSSEAASIMETITAKNGWSSNTTVNTVTNTYVGGGSNYTIGSTGISMTIPSTLEADDLTSDDIAEGMVGYWYNDDIDFALYIEDDEYTLDEILEEYSEESNLSQSGTTWTNNGIQFAYVVYEETYDGDTYQVISYFCVKNSQTVSFCFYMKDLSASSIAAQIIESVK